MFFWDKLNKSNYYLELSIENAHLSIDDRLVSHLSDDLISDGGQWDMSVNLIEGYGVVPQSVYPESFHSSLSSPLNALLKTKLREHALILRRLSASLRASLTPEDLLTQTLRSKKEELMKEVYNILTATLGVPPRPDESFVWEYLDADGKAGRWEGTPAQYAKVFATKPYSVCYMLQPLDLSFDPLSSHQIISPSLTILVMITPSCTRLTSWAMFGVAGLFYVCPLFPFNPSQKLIND